MTTDSGPGSADRCPFASAGQGRPAHPRASPTPQAGGADASRRWTPWAGYGEDGSTTTVDTDETERVRPVLGRGNIRALARWAVAVEERYGCPMDLEWAKDGITGQLFPSMSRRRTSMATRRAWTTSRPNSIRDPGQPPERTGLDMKANTTAQQLRTKQWILRVDLFEEGDVTKVHAVLGTGDNRLESRTIAHRNPNDPPAPEIGDEYAAARALIDIGNQLLRAGRTDAAANEPPLYS
ncbi:dsRBD fold-containing protein [Kitasatospora sp. NPDC101157]|uniref:dsRBD fold-containing protein n=1 Tax=Kitasatospora sp. NPDC101157 TaxID=3364098 RepID=UPI003803979E